jgi:hypothetical protein
MSGEGVIAVRLSRSLSVLLCMAADWEGVTVHVAARILLSVLRSFTPAELKALKDPPRELGQERISPYADWRLIGAPMAVTRNIILTKSAIFPRLHSDLQFTKEIEFVQHGARGKLQFAHRNEMRKQFCERLRK